MNKFLRYLCTYLCLMLAGCINHPIDSPITSGSEYTNHQDQIAIYVVNHGWHTGIIIPEEHVSESLRFVKEDLGRGKFYEFGWGDKGFYQSDEITAWLAIKAIFWSTPSVMHVVKFHSSPSDYFRSSDVAKIFISMDRLEALGESIAKSFDHSTLPPLPTREGLYGKSYFYQGHGRYYATNTCNTWTARMLKTAGFPIDDFMTLTASAVMNKIREIEVNQLNTKN